jgi:hypothetical protein
MYPPVYSLGCWANVDFSYISDAPDGFKAVKLLVRNVCKNFCKQLQSGYKETDGILTAPLSSAMKSVFAAFALYGDEQLSFLPDFQSTHLELTRCFMNDEVNPSCILQKFVSSLCTDSWNSIPDGLKFLE